MKISTLLFCFMISCALVQYVTSFVAMATVITVVEVVEFIVAAISFIKAAYDTLRPKTPLELCSASIDQTAVDHKVARNLPRVMSNIDDIKHLFLAKSLELERIMIYEHKKTEVWKNMMVFNDAIEKIRVIFIGLMQKLPTEPGQLFDMKEIFYYVLHHTRDGALQMAVDQLSDQVFAPLTSKESIVDSLRKFFQNQKTEHNDCGLGQSPHEYFYSLYHETLTIEIEALVFHAFAYYFLYRYKDDVPGGSPFAQNPDETLKDYTSAFKSRIDRYQHAFTRAMASASREIRPCDRDSITDKNYKISHPIIELEGAIQYTIKIKSREDIGLNIGKQVVFPRYCIGKEVHCDTRSTATKACINPHGKRRYEWFIDSTAAPPRCNSRLQGTLEPAKFDIQVCMCNGNVPGENSTHVVNLRPVEADVYKNMVVTGMRFVVQRGVLHIQIQQGELQGNLGVKNVQWKPIEDISHQVYQARRIHSYEPFQPDEPQLVEDVDFMVVKIDERDKINMEKVSVDKDYVLTGVKFDLDDQKRLQLAVIQTKFNVTTGKLMKYCGKKLVQPANITRQRYDIGKKLGTPAYKDFAPVDLPAQYLQFDASDVAAPDYGQTTIPFFDATEVTAIPPSPLGGAGLVFKTAQDYPGIISPILLSLDFSAYVDASIRDADEVLRKKMEELTQLLNTQRPGLAPSPAA